MKIKKNWGGGGEVGGGVGARGRVEGGQGGCDRRIEVFGKIHKKKIFFFWGGGVGRVGGEGGRVGRVRVDVNEVLKFLGKFTQKKFGGGGRAGGQVGGSGWWGVRVDVNAMLGVGGDVGYGGCEPRIEGIVQCTKSRVPTEIQNPNSMIIPLFFHDQ